MVYACEREREKGCESAGELCNLSILCLLSPPLTHPNTQPPTPSPPWPPGCRASHQFIIRTPLPKKKSCRANGVKQRKGENTQSPSHSPRITGSDCDRRKGTVRQRGRERELKKPLQDFSSRFVRDCTNPLTDPQTGLIIDHLAAISGRVRTGGRLSEEYAAEFTFQVKLLTPTTCRLSLCTAAHVRALHPPH